MKRVGADYRSDAIEDISDNINQVNEDFEKSPKSLRMCIRYKSYRDGVYPGFCETLPGAGGSVILTGE